LPFENIIGDGSYYKKIIKNYKERKKERQSEKQFLPSCAMCQVLGGLLCLANECVKGTLLGALAGNIRERLGEGQKAKQSAGETATKESSSAIIANIAP
jgi:hypothetical protein